MSDPVTREQLSRHAFLVVESSIPSEMTIAEWRRQRVPADERRHPRVGRHHAAARVRSRRALAPLAPAAVAAT
jgi:hypothetical protein